MSAIDITIVNVAMPTLKNTFGVSMAVIEWIAMAYMLTLTIFLPLFGRLADIYGRSTLYTLGFVVFSGGSLLCGISETATFMIVSRVIQALGAGLLQANSIALITHVFPAKERGKAIGIQGAVQAIAMAVGPLVGGILIASTGWRTIFFINIPIGVFATLAALCTLPTDERIREKQKVDYLGAVFFASGLGLIILAVNEAVKFGWGSHIIIIYLLSGIALLSLFIITEIKSEHPLIDLKLFKTPTFLLGNLTGMLSYYVLFAVMFLVPFYLQNVLGYNVAFTGSLLTYLLLAMAVVAPVSGYISDKHGPRIMATSGMLISAVACFTLMLLGQSAQPSWLVIVLPLFGVGMGLFTPPNNSAIMGSIPMEKLGVAGGVLNMMRSLGLIFGVDISGVIFSSQEHQYLSEKGYSNVRHVFSNDSIPMPVKANAFMHGFMMVIMVLIIVAVLSALLSSVRKVKTIPIIDHDAAGTAVVSSGFFNGFSREARNTALFIMLLLFTGIIGTLAFSRLVNGSYLVPETTLVQNTTVVAEQNQKALEARKLAMAYYSRKYNDSNVNIDVKPEGDHFEANVTRNGEFVKRLSVKDNTITEQRTGIRDWAFNLLINVN